MPSRCSSKALVDKLEPIKRMTTVRLIWKLATMVISSILCQIGTDGVRLRMPLLLFRGAGGGVRGDAARLLELSWEEDKENIHIF